MKLDKNIYNEVTKLHYKLNEKDVYIPEIMADFYKRNGVRKYGRMHCMYLIKKHESYY